MSLAQAVPDASFVAEVAVVSAVERAGGCARPVRLRGSTVLVNTRTGAVTERYSSLDELDGQTYVRCGDRRAQVCPVCS
ncbi:MAG: replication initiator, partial [Stackebrandtia sp.]